MSFLFTFRKLVPVAIRRIIFFDVLERSSEGTGVPIARAGINASEGVMGRAPTSAADRM